MRYKAKKRYSALSTVVTFTLKQSKDHCMVNEHNKKRIKAQSKKMVVGIDIAKHAHYVTLLDQAGNETSSGIKIENNLDGFKKLEKMLSSVAPHDVIIGVEPTGHYWKCLGYHFAQKNYDIVLTNPFHVHRSKEIIDNSRTKNDKKDSRVIAQLVRGGNYLQSVLLTGNSANLRRLSHLRESIVKNATQSKIRLRVLLDEYLPEHDTCFSAIDTVSCRKLLRTYGISGLRAKEFHEEKVGLIVKASRHRITRNRAENIIKCFEQSIGITAGLDAAEIELVTQLDRLEFHLSELESIEQHIKRYLDKTDEAQTLLQIPGVGPITVASLLGEIGSFSAFENVKQLEKFAGLNLVENASGKFKGRTKISKRGRPLLRQVLYKAALTVMQSSEEFNALYRYKTEQCHKPGRVALTTIAAKLLRTMFVLAKKKCTYNGKLVIQGLPSA